MPKLRQGRRLASLSLSESFAPARALLSHSAFIVRPTSFCFLSSCSSASGSLNALLNPREASSRYLYVYPCSPRCSFLPSPCPTIALPTLSTVLITPSRADSIALRRQSHHPHNTRYLLRVHRTPDHSLAPTSTDSI